MAHLNPNLLTISSSMHVRILLASSDKSVNTSLARSLSHLSRDLRLARLETVNGGYALARGRIRKWKRDFGYASIIVIDFAVCSNRTEEGIEAGSAF